MRRGTGQLADGGQFGAVHLPVAVVVAISMHIGKGFMFYVCTTGVFFSLRGCKVGLVVIFWLHSLELLGNAVLLDIRFLAERRLLLA